MLTQSWMYDGILYIYALSLLFYFSDFVERNTRVKRYGTGLLTFVWILQSVLFILRYIEYGNLPFMSMFDVLFFFSWVLVTLSLILNLVFRIDLLVFFVNVLGFSVLAFSFFSNPNVTASLGDWQIEDELLFIHISLAIASYAAFSLSAIFSFMYLFLHGKLKAKKWSATMRRLPSLEKVTKYAYVCVVIGIPLLITSVSLGVVWIIVIGESGMLFDIKVVHSLLVLLAYALYLVMKLTFKAPGQRLAYWNIGSFVLILASFIVSNFSDFHQW
jgi:HemX protein